MAKSKRKSTTKAKRSLAQIAATKRMLAARAKSKANKPKAQKPHPTKAKKAKVKKKASKKATKKKATKARKPKSHKAKARTVAKPVKKTARKASAKKKAPRRTMRLKVTATAKQAGMADCVRIRTPQGAIRDIKLSGRIGYQAGTALFMPGTESRQNLPFEVPGQVTGAKQGEVLSISYHWGGATYTHSFNGRLPAWLELPGGVYAATGLAWSHARGFKDAS
jgi:hypothetical protein